MATPLNQRERKPKTYWPWIVVGCVVVFFLSLVLAGLAGVIFYFYMGPDG